MFVYKREEISEETYNLNRSIITDCFMVLVNCGDPKKIIPAYDLLILMIDKKQCQEELGNIHVTYFAREFCEHSGYRSGREYKVTGEKHFYVEDFLSFMEAHHYEAHLNSLTESNHIDLSYLQERYPQALQPMELVIPTEDKTYQKELCK